MALRRHGTKRARRRDTSRGARDTGRRGLRIVCFLMRRREGHAPRRLSARGDSIAPVLSALRGDSGECRERRVHLGGVGDGLPAAAGPVRGGPAAGSLMCRIANSFRDGAHCVIMRLTRSEIARAPRLSVLPHRLAAGRDQQRVRLTLPRKAGHGTGKATTTRQPIPLSRRWRTRPIRLSPCTGAARRRAGPLLSRWQEKSAAA